MERKAKQVIVIRSDLKMRRGKEIAQGSHASMAFLTKNIQHSLAYDELKNEFCQISLSESAQEWLRYSFVKICVRVENEQELIDIYQKALDAKLEVNLITDNGLTEFNGVPTKTCLAIGPNWSEEIDKITGYLKLY